MPDLPGCVFQVICFEHLCRLGIIKKHVCAIWVRYRRVVSCFLKELLWDIGEQMETLLLIKRFELRSLTAVATFNLKTSVLLFSVEPI